MSRGDVDHGSVVRSPAQQAPPVSLAIERIVIDGPALHPLQALRLQRSIECELTRLLASQRTTLPTSSIERLLAPPLRGHAQADPVRFGIAIARSLHTALGTRE